MKCLFLLSITFFKKSCFLRQHLKYDNKYLLNTCFIVHFKHSLYVYICIYLYTHIKYSGWNIFQFYDISQFKFLIADFYKISLDFILYIKLVLIWRKYTFIWFSFNIWHWTIVSVEYFKKNILCVAKADIITNWRYT